MIEDLSSGRSEGKATNYAMALSRVAIACAPSELAMSWSAFRGLLSVAPGYLPTGLRPFRPPNNMRSVNGYDETIDVACRPSWFSRIKSHWSFCKRVRRYDPRIMDDYVNRTARADSLLPRHHTIAHMAETRTRAHEGCAIA